MNRHDLSLPAPDALARAEARGRQLLLYAAEGPLGGSFVCFRCGASALQPVLLQHTVDCLYGGPDPSPAGR
jgi:hypothetical protein